MQARILAARILQRVLDEGRSLSSVLPVELDKKGNSNIRALTQEFCYGVLRWLPRLDAVTRQLIAKPLKRRDRDVHYLIVLGLYQLIYMRIPSHAAVAETVKAVQQIGKPWAKGMANAVLRGFERDSEAILTVVDQQEEARYAHPAWLLELIKTSWPQDWEPIVRANNQRPPMALRVNERKKNRSDYLRELGESGISARAVPDVKAGVVLDKPIGVESLPGFSLGHVSVQDTAAQLAAELLDVHPGHAVLDACAAPGGKTAHVLEHYPDLELLVAVDSDGERLQRVEQNLDRLDLHAKLVCEDAAASAQWWNEEPFDRILLDAPCTASGVIRRHPDIKYLRRPGDIEAMMAQQWRLLEALWPLLKPGGMLLYATCSILPQENANQIARFLETHHDSQEVVIESTWGRRQSCGRQILPGDDDMDGFYYARLSKVNNVD